MSTFLGIRAEPAPGEDKSVTSERGQRLPWQRPAMVIHPCGDAETGVNSTTDANNTFS